MPEIGAIIERQLNNVLQSYEQYSGSNTTITANVYEGSRGSGYKKLLHTDDVKLKNCIIQIKNNDNRCLVRAITVGLAII